MARTRRGRFPRRKNVALARSGAKISTSRTSPGVINVLAVTMRQSTGYADVDAVLADLLAGVRGTLGPQLVGVYLDGSLAARAPGASLATISLTPRPPRSARTNLGCVSTNGFVASTSTRPPQCLPLICPIGSRRSPE